ncbi:MAG TPA: hypothetical protein VMZ51_08490 [Acidimicrobiales bacterium]|nr:hypothetical protein [Acidimicrobiales bacterium]
MSSPARVRVAALVAALIAALLPTGLSGTAGAAAPAQGSFSLIQMVHTTAYNDGAPQNTAPWDGSAIGGPFRYAGIPCSGNAPVNNISTDLTTYNTRLPGSRSPASTRSHPLSFSVVETAAGGLRLRGTDTLTVCKLAGGATTDGVADASRSKIFFEWDAEVLRTSPEEMAWTGTFKITGGTGVYQDLTGSGIIGGYFFCFAPEGCASLGEFRDGQFTMQGNYSDPTVDALTTPPPGLSVPVPATIPMPKPAASGVDGAFSFMQMVHTTTYNDGTPQNTIPWNGTATGGPFRYASIPCTGNAPVNNIATDLTTYNARLPGSRVPASTRSHPLEFSVTPATATAPARLEGTDVITVCDLKGGPNPAPDSPDATKPKISVRWTADVIKTSEEEMSWAGTFTITGGTGIYEGLTGSGSIAGYFLCFATEGCDTLNEFRDGQFVMQGTYRDASVPGYPAGYWSVASDGGIFAFGGAPFLGSTGGIKLNKPVVGMARTPTGKGYWLVATDGGVFAFGDAAFHGSTGAIKLNQPIVGMAATPSGKGYWLVASDGGIFAFGDAAFKGSTGAIKLNKPVVGMSSTPTGKGYYLVATDGGIFAFGDAVFKGSTGAIKLNQPIKGMATTPTGRGYWLVASDGGIFAFGDAAFKGSTGAIKLNKPIVGMAATPSGQGYWLVATDGGIFAFGDAPFRGSTGNLVLNQPVVGMASQI